MKIASESDNELILKEGNVSGIVIGAILILAAIGLVRLIYLNQMVIWIAIGIGVIGLAVIFLSYSIIVDFDKGDGQIRYEKKHLIGASFSTYEIADVLQVETRKVWHIQNTGNNRSIAMPRRVLVSQSVIVLKNGKELQLDHQKNSSGTPFGSVLMAGSGAESATANQVATFLGVPFREIAPPDSIDIGSGGSEGIQL